MGGARRRKRIDNRVSSDWIFDRFAEILSFAERRDLFFPEEKKEKKEKEKKKEKKKEFFYYLDLSQFSKTLPTLNT